MTKILHSFACRFGLSLCVLLCGLTATLMAQSSTVTYTPNDGSTPLALSPGAPEGSFALSGLDTVNLFNGNLNFHLPLVDIKGRGGVGMPVMFEIDAKQWEVQDRHTVDRWGNPDDQYTPIQATWAGISTGYGPGVLLGRQSGLSPNRTCSITNIRYRYWTTLTRLTFTTPDGTQYEFRDALTGGQPIDVSDPCASGASRGRVFITADGTAATFVSDTTIYDRTGGQMAYVIYPSGYLMLRDGTRYRIDSGEVTWMRDRNGNKLTFTYDQIYASHRVTSITDSLNRQVTFTYADMQTVFYDQITYKGFGGAQRTVLVNYSLLQNALRAGYSLQTLQGLFPELNGSYATTYNPYVVSSVSLPNNQQYQFSYNSYGELARIVLPTGGAIEYDMNAGSGVQGDSEQIFRFVTERRTYPDGSSGGTFESRTTFTLPFIAGASTVDHFNQSGTLLAREKHYYYGNPNVFPGPTAYPAWQSGREFQTESYDTDGTTVLRSVTNLLTCPPKTSPE